MVNTGKQTWLPPMENWHPGKGRECLSSSYLIPGRLGWEMMNVSLERNLINDLFLYLLAFYRESFHRLKCYMDTYYLTDPSGPTLAESLEELGREEGGEQELLFVCLFVYPTTHHQSCVLMNMAGKVLNSPPLHCHVTVGETMP